MTVIRKLFSGAGRKAIYAVVGALLALAVILGLLPAGSETEILDNVSKGLGVIATVLAIFNVDSDEPDESDVAADGVAVDGLD